MAPITPLQYVRDSYAGMTEFQQQEFLAKNFGVTDISMVDAKAAAAYCKTNNIKLTQALANNSTFVAANTVSDEIKNNAAKKYQQASASWDAWHQQLNFANAWENFSTYNRDLYLRKATAITTNNGEIDKTSNDYKKYMTYKLDATNAQSLFRTALSGEQMAVHNMQYANNLSNISLFARGEQV